MLAISAILLSRDKVVGIIVNLSIILTFAIIYFLLGTNENFNFVNDPTQKKLTPITAIYFSFVSHCTIGYGDIVPKSTIIRCIVMIQCLFMIVFLFL